MPPQRHLNSIKEIIDLAVTCMRSKECNNIPPQLLYIRIQQLNITHIQTTSVLNYHIQMQFGDL